MSTETNPVLRLGQIELIAHCRWHNLDEWWVQSIRGVSPGWVGAQRRGGVRPSPCLAASRDPITLHLLTTPIPLYKQQRDPFIEGKGTKRDRRRKRTSGTGEEWAERREMKQRNKEMFSCLALEGLAPLDMMDEPRVWRDKSWTDGLDTHSWPQQSRGSGFSRLKQEGHLVVWS